MREASVEQFLDECGWTGPLRLGLESVEGSAISLRQDLFQPFIVVGRKEAADIRLDHPDVSRRHAYLQVVAGRVFCIDLLSRTGTHWEHGRQPWGWLAPSSAIRIGTNRLSAWGGHTEPRDAVPEDGGLPISRSFELPGAPDVVLERLNPEGGRSAWWVNRAILLLGRSPSCKVHLPSPRCAAVHASLVRTGQGTWLVDLCSTSGTFVNGDPVRYARLTDGDEIRLGHYRLRIHQGQAATRILSRSSLPVHRTLSRSNGDHSASHHNGNGIPNATQRAEPGPDPLAIELLREIRRQQSESTEQFRQLIGMFYQMHQDQMALVTDELDRLGRLVEGQTVVRNPQDNPFHPPEGSLGEARPRLPLPPPSSSIPSEAEPIAEPMPESPPLNGAPPDSAPGTKTDPLDSSGDFHLVLARRLVQAHKNEQGLLRALFGWLTGNSNHQEA